MKLIDAYNLLVDDGIADNHRYFSEVYKLYGFDDSRTLKEYLDFIDHEPVHWLRGFPAKLTTKLAFSKPKTAVIKLLKKQTVVNALGAEYVSHIHNNIWNTFKQEVDKIIQERISRQQQQQQQQENSAPVVSQQRLQDYGYCNHSSDDGTDHLISEEGEGNEVKEGEEGYEGDVGSDEISIASEEPTPPLKNYRTINLLSAVPTMTTHNHNSQQVADDRVVFLKSVLLKMSETLPAGAAEAFRLLVSRV